MSAIQPMSGASIAAIIDLACDEAESTVAMALSFDKSATRATPIGFLRFSIDRITINPIMANT